MAKSFRFPVEWRKPEHIPFILLHSFTNLPPPLISLFCQSVPRCRYFIVTASPRGKPRTQKILAYIIHRSTVLCQFRVTNLAPPTMAVQNHGCTPPNPLPLWKTAENQQSFHEAVDEFLFSANFRFFIHRAVRTL